MTRFLLIVVVPLCVCLALIFSVLVFGMMNAGVRRADIQFLYVRENSADDIFLYDTRTGIHLNLTRQSISAAAPRWSPDGDWLLIESIDETFGNELYRLSLNDGRIEALTHIRIEFIMDCSDQIGFHPQHRLGGEDHARRQRQLGPKAPVLGLEARGLGGAAHDRHDLVDVEGTAEPRCIVCTSGGAVRAPW